MTIICDPEDAWLLTRYSWHLNNSGYVSGGGTRLFHRVVMQAKPGQEVHHKNHNKQDCRKENLEFVTHAENAEAHWQLKHPAKRLPKTSTTKIVGVSWDKKANKWRAYTTHPMRVIGRSIDFFEACCLRKSWERYV